MINLYSYKRAESCLFGMENDAEDPLTSAAIAAMTTPPTSNQRKTLNTFLSTLRSSGVLPALDSFYFLHSHSSQSSLLNLISPSQVLSPVNSPTFTAYKGWAGDASTSYIRMPDAIGAAGKKFVQDNAMWGVGIREQGNGAYGVIIGNTSTSLIQTTVENTASQNGGFKMNGTTSDNWNMPVNLTRVGNFTGIRRDSANKILYLNGAVRNNIASVSTGVDNSQQTTLIRVGGLYSNDYVGHVFSGSAITDAQITALETAINAYYTGYVA